MRTPPERLVFGYNVTDALNLAIPGLVGQGDHVITTNLEHNSVIRPVNHMVRDHGAESHLPAIQRARIHRAWTSFARRYAQTRGVVIVNHGSNVIGTVQPIKEIGAICRETRSHLRRDTAQTAGVIPIDMKRDEHRRSRLHRPQGPDGKHGNRRTLGSQARRDSSGPQRRHWRALGGPLSPDRLSMASEYERPT